MSTHVPPAEGSCYFTHARRTESTRGGRRPDRRVRRHREVLQVEARNLRERRSGDDTAEDRAVRLVDADEDEQARRLHGDHPDERRDVLAGRVPVRPGDLRRSRLAGDGVAGDLRGVARRAVLVDDAGEHRLQLFVDRRRDDPPVLEAVQRPSADLLDEVRLDPHAAVRDRAVGGGDLDRRDGDALADRHVPDRRARPLVGVRRNDAAALAGEVEAGRLAEAEPVDPVHELGRAELLGDRDRADVRRVRQDPRDGQRLGAALLRVVDALVGYLDARRERERRVRRDDPVGQRARDGHELEDGTGLEDVRDRVVRLQRLRDARRVVRFVAGRLRHREHCAGMRVEDDRRGRLGTRLAHGVAQHLLGVRLDLAVDRREDRVALVLGRRADDVDRAPERVADDRLPAGLAGEALVVLHLEPGEALVVRAREADHLRPDAQLRIRALLLRIAVHAGEAPLQERRRLERVGEALDVDEARLAVEQLRVERVRIDPEVAVRGERDVARTRDLARVAVDGRRLLADCELEPGAVEDRAAAGGDRDRLVVLALGEPAERRRLHALQPHRARKRPCEDEDEKRKQQADAPVGLALTHLVRSSVGSMDYPASGSAPGARTQGVLIVVTIGATEDAATDGETPPGTTELADERTHLPRFTYPYVDGSEYCNPSCFTACCWMRCDATSAEYCDCSAAFCAISFVRCEFVESRERFSCSTATFTNTTPASRIPLTTIQRIPPRVRGCAFLRTRVRGRGRATGSTVTAWACERLAIRLWSRCGGARTARAGCARSPPRSDARRGAASRASSPRSRRRTPGR